MAKASAKRLGAAACAAVLLSIQTGCGVADGLDRLEETVDESLDDSELTSPDDAVDVDGETTGDGSSAAEWLDYADPDGVYSVDFPRQPEASEVEQDGVTFRTWSIQVNADALDIMEFRLKPGTEYDFDLGVTGAADEAVDALQQQLDGTVTYEISDQSSTFIGTYDGVRFIASVLEDGQAYATLHSAIYDIDRTIVVLSALDTESDNPTTAERFIDSFRLLS